MNRENIKYERGWVTGEDVNLKIGIVFSRVT